MYQASQHVLSYMCFSTNVLQILTKNQKKINHFKTGYTQKLDFFKTGYTQIQKTGQLKLETYYFKNWTSKLKKGKIKTGN